MSSSSTRRDFLGAATIAATGACVAIATPLSAQVYSGRTPQPRPSPNAPTNGNVPGGLDIHPTDKPQRDPTAAIDGAQINSMVQELFQRVLELKQEADRVNLNSTLPLDFIARAKQIEKLAKNIRNHATG